MITVAKASNIESNTDASSQVAKACAAFGAAAKEAIGWVDDEANSERVGPEKGALEELLRKAAFKSRKLGQTVERPMCVGVFGPSQHGKSYLVSVLARKGKRLTALFDDPRGEVDFLKELNPGGGKESTGLVTRFTIKPIKSPAGFPVALRLFNQTDIVKIIINSYANDGDPNLEVLPTVDELIAHLAEQEKSAGKDYNDVLREEDIWDLQEYVQSHTKYKPINSYCGPAWDRIARLAPKLSISKRAELYSFFWGRHKPLTDLYLKITESLARLGFIEDAFCQLEALMPSDIGILNVQALDLLVQDDASSLKISTPDGKPVSLPRSILAAITAELRITVPRPPWEFFDHTDLLDFPGYRSRTEVDLSSLFSKSGNAPTKEMFLRGKVDYLFQRYTADQELNSLLLCLKPSTMEVATLPPVIDEWVGITHGVSPEERARAATTLFFCLTMFDVHFIESGGDTDPKNRFFSRMHASLLKPFAPRPESWPVNWTPNQPFKNCYWIRNPEVKAEAIIQYDGNDEKQIIADKLDRIALLRAAHNSVPEVQQHFFDPAKSWDEVMKLNDGGISHLANSLAKVCLPQMKTDQLRSRLVKLRAEVSGKLSRYHVSGDMAKRLKECDAAFKVMLKDIDTAIKREQFGALVAGLCIDRIYLRDALLAAPRPEDEDQNPGKPSIIDILGGDDTGDGPGAEETISSAPRSRYYIDGVRAVAIWAKHLTMKAENEAFARSLGMKSTTIRDIAAELVAAARRKKLAEDIAGKLDQILHFDVVDNRIAKTTLIASTVLNAFTSTMGYDSMPAAKRPTAGTGASKREIFPERSLVHDMTAVGKQPANFALNYAADWVRALKATMTDNASTEGGKVQDVRQNTRLGEVLETLNAPV